MENNITNALISLLNKGIVRFTYRKVDGTIRDAVGSRNLDAVRKFFGIYVPAPKTGRNNPTAYYDIVKEDWRSFKAENVLSINDIDIKEIKGVSGGRIVKVNEPTEVEIPINFGGFSGGMPIGGTKKGELPKREGMVFNPIAVSEEHTTLPIGGMPIEDFAKLVAKYVVEEIISRIR